MTRLFADVTSLSFSSVNLFEIERVLNETYQNSVRGQKDGL